MKLVQTKLYSQLIVISDYILLGILWVIVSLPLVTIVPATVALFYVMKQWQDQGASGNVLSYFFKGFRRRLLANLLLSCLTIVMTILLNALLLEHQQLLLIAGYAAGIVYLMFLLSWMTNCASRQGSLVQLFEQSAVDLLLHLLGNLACCGILTGFALLIFVFPPFIFIFAGGVWKIIQVILTRKRQVKK